MSTALLPPGARQDVPAALPNTRPLRQLVGRARLVLRAGSLLRGLALTVGLSGTALLAVALLDVLFPPPPDLAGFRLAGLIVILILTAGAVVGWVLGPLVRPLPAVHVARRIEQDIPGIHDRLVSCIDLDSRRRLSGSPEFYHRLADETLQRVRDFRPTAILDVRRLRRAGLFAGVAAAVFLLAWLLLAGRFQTALARVFSPLDDIPPTSGVAYTVLTGDRKWPRGRDIPFRVRVEQGAPESLRLEITGAVNGRRLSYPLQRSPDDPSLWTFALGSAPLAPGFEDGFRYRIVGGGTWSRLFTLRLVESPTLTSLDVALHYPDYLGLAEPVVVDEHGPVAGPVGSRVEVVATARGEIVAGDVVLGDPPQDRRPLRPSGEGWIGSFPLDRRGSFRVELRDELGLANTEERPREVVAVPDEPPRIVLRRPGPQVVRATAGKELLEIELSDDFGLAELILVLQKDPTLDPAQRVLRTYPPFRPSEPQARQSDFVQHDLDLAELGLRRGDVLRFRLEVRDRKGQTARTPECVVRIQPGANTAEQQLAAFDRTQDLVLQKFAQLVADQAAVRDQVALLAARGRAPSQDMALLAAVQQRNAQAAELLRSDLAWSVEQLGQLPNMPGQLAEQMAAAERLFERLAIPALKDLAGRTARGANPGQPSDLPALQNQSGRLQKELEAIQRRLAAINAARKKAAIDRDEALKDLGTEVQKQNAGLAVRELEELRNHLAGLRDELQKLEELSRQAADAGAARQQQDEVEESLQDALARARDLLGADPPQRLGSRQPAGSEEEAEPTSLKNEERSPFRPALGRSPPKAEKTSSGGLRDLDQARQSLDADRQTVDQMLQKLRQPTADAAKEVLQSAALKQALAMARRMQESRGKAAARKGAARGAPGASEGNLTGTPPVADTEAKLDKLDPQRRNALLRMAPRLREELLQGMEEKGPEGYRKLIDDYFRRLTEVPEESRGGR